MTTPVTVLLPAHREGPLLEEAAASIFAQTHQDFALLIILNAVDPPTAEAAERLAARDTRVRIIRRPQGHLAGALNAGIAAAQTEWLVRMDADDTCAPERIECQLEFAAAHPELAAIGSAFITVDGQGRRLAVHRPPVDPREARWRLLISNPFAHGSMLLRRSALIALNGYDESLPRAQDLELWLRLSGRIAAAPDVLYTHRQRAVDSYSGSDQQAAVAARLLANAWLELPAAPAHDVIAALQHVMTPVLHKEGPGIAEVESRLTEQGPTRELIMAWLWAREHTPSLTRRATDICLGSRIREVLGPKRAAGLTEIKLWGSGAHTGRALPHLHAMGIRVTAIVDDYPQAQPIYGLPIERTDTLAAGDTVLLSSDTFESLMWRRSAPARARGVRVIPLYAAYDADDTEHSEDDAGGTAEVS